MRFMEISLKAARVNKNLTQEQAAKAISVYKKTITNWEKGYTVPKHNQLKQLCKIYGIPIECIKLQESE